MKCINEQANQWTLLYYITGGCHTITRQTARDSKAKRSEGQDNLTPTRLTRIQPHERHTMIDSARLDSARLEAAECELIRSR